MGVIEFVARYTQQPLCVWGEKSLGKRSAKGKDKSQILCTFNWGAILKGAPCLMTSAPATAVGPGLVFQSEHTGSSCPLDLEHPFPLCLKWKENSLSAYYVPAGSTNALLRPLVRKLAQTGKATYSSHTAGM